MKYVVVLALFFAKMVCLCDTAEAQTVSRSEFPPFPYAMTVEALQQRRALNSPMFLVDVRSPEAFERISIPNALNIPLFAVKTKAFLTTQPLVLIDEGFRPRYVNEICAQLTEAGFDVRFLLGGLNAWNARRGELLGDVLAQRGLNKVSAQQIFSEQPAEGWLMIDASETGNDDTAIMSPHTLHIPFNPLLPDRWFSDIQEAVSAYMTDSAREPLLLLSTRSGTGYDAIERALDSGRLPSVFFLAGGMQGYLGFLAQQKILTTGPQEISTNCTPCAR